MDGKLNKKIIYKGNIVLETGLHIGGSNSSLNIGGLDSFVIRNPLTNIPYIPGSSLKGKMRALIELSDGTISEAGLATVDPNSRAGALFGIGASAQESHPSRLIIRDSELDTEHWEENFNSSNTDLPYTEAKTENTINRITAEATPRTIERVPSGAHFKLDMVLNVFDNDDESKLRQTLDDAINLLQDDYLGGNGSRGYGKVKLNYKIEEKLYK